MSDLGEILKKIKPNVTDSSKRVYLGYLRGVYKLASGDTPIENLKWIEDEYLDLIKAIKGLVKKSKHTKRNYLNALIIFLNKKKGKIYESLSEERDKINDFFEDESNKNKLNEKQCSNFLTKDELKHVMDTYKKEVDHFINKKKLVEKEINVLQEYVLLKLIVNYSGRNSFATLKKTTPTKFNRLTEKAKVKNNWLILGRKNLRIRLYNFKVKTTDKFYEIEGITDEIEKLIRIFVKHTKERTFIFHTVTGLPMSNLSLTTYLNNIFKRFFPKKLISTNMLRHITVTHNNGEGFCERRKEAKNFNHSVSMHDRYILLDE